MTMESGQIYEDADGRLCRVPIFEIAAPHDVRLWIEAGGDLLEVDSKERSPLHRATHGTDTAGSNLRTMRLLLDAGANPAARDRSGRTPLFMAAARGNETAVRMLIETGAALTAATRYGETPYHAAASAPGGDASRVIGLLLLTGTDVNTADLERRTPLHVAASRGTVATLRALLEAGADPNLADKDGYTSLHLAAAFSSTPHLRALLEAGADPSARDLEGNTPDELAAFASKPELASLIREYQKPDDSTAPGM